MLAPIPAGQKSLSPPWSRGNYPWGQSVLMFKEENVGSALVIQQCRDRPLPQTKERGFLIHLFQQKPLR